MMPRAEGQPALPGVINDHVDQPTLGSNSSQVHFQQGGQMGRIGSILESVELVFDQQSHLAQQAQLVGRGYDNPTTRLGQARQLAQEGTRIFQMLDRFHCRHGVRRTRSEWHVSGIEVCQ